MTDPARLPGGEGYIGVCKEIDSDRLADSMRLAHTLALALALSIAASIGADAGTQSFYRLKSATLLPGASPSWDYLAFERSRNRLFIGRRKDGVSVYDVHANKLVARIDRSEGANATVLIPALGLGYTANQDGSTTRFELSTLKTLGRISFGHSADAGFYDSATGQIMFTMGDDRALAFMDARTGKVVATLAMPSEKLEAAAPDGRGNFFLAERDKNMVVRIDAKAHATTAAWPVSHCEEPTAIAFDPENARIFVGCRGKDPVLAVVNAGSGETIATPPIGRGNDGIVYDASLHRLFASNGVDANLVVYDQVTKDRYSLAEVTTTRPGARTMALNPATKDVYLVTAEGIVDPTKPINGSVTRFYPNRYIDNSFTVLTYTMH